jgi:hypothetical protein
LSLNVQPNNKLEGKLLGPFEVLSQYKNDVEVKHLVTGGISVFHVTRLKPYIGSKEEAYRVALLDHDQYVVKEIITYKGDPLIRNSVEFEVLFEDGTLKWLPWSKDIFDSVPYEDFCRKHPQLFPLLVTADVARKSIATLNKTAISEVAPGDTVYVNLRSWGEIWYTSLKLPDLFHKNYVVEAKYSHFTNASRTKIQVSYPVFSEVFNVDHFHVRSYGSCKEFDSQNSVLITKQFVTKNSAIFGTRSNHEKR